MHEMEIHKKWKSEKNIKTVKEKKKMHKSKRLEYCFVCFISLSNVPRFKGFLNSEDSFVNYSGIIEVTGVIITPVLHILTFQMCSFFLVEKHLQSHQCRSKDNRGKEFYTTHWFEVQQEA